MDPPRDSEGIVEELRYYKSLLNQRIGVASALFHPAPDAATFQLKLIRNVTETNYNGNVSFSDLYAEADNRLRKCSLVPIQEPAYEIDSVSPVTGSRIFRVKRDGEKLYFESWIGGRIVDSQLATDRLEFIYNDDVFGGVSWSQDEKRVIFVAEKKPDKEVKLQDLNLSERNKDAEKDVNFYLNARAERTTFGESLQTKKQPEVWVYDLDSKELGKVTNIDYQNLNPAFPTFQSQNGIVFSAYKRTDPQMGLRSCLNRPCSLWFLESIALKVGTLEPNGDNEAKAVNLAPDYYFAGRPLLTSDNKNVVFFGLKSHVLEHMTCMELCVVGLPPSASPADQKTPKILVPIIEDNTENFNGIFTEHAAMRKATILKLSDGSDRVIFDSFYRGIFQVYAVDPISGKMEIIRPFKSGGSYTLLASHPTIGVVIVEINSKTFRKLHFVSPKNYTKYFGDLKEAGGDTFASGFQENCFYNFAAEEIPRMTPTQIMLFRKMAEAEPHLIRSPSGAEAMLWIPKYNASEEGGKLPLVLNIHGGPHAYGHFNGFIGFDLGLFLNAGYAVLIPNYTGSGGYGLRFLRGLLGKAGTVDVSDCIDLVDETLRKHGEQIDGGRIASAGYSYGGYLTAYLATHPEFSRRLKVAIPFNPVIDFPSFIGSSDIPDWAYAESQSMGRSLDYQLTDAELSGMWRSSPISLAKHVQCPVLVMVGAADLRVPPKNGILFYRALRSMGKPNIEMNVYSGENHSLPGTEANLHSVITMMRFLKKHL